MRRNYLKILKFVMLVMTIVCICSGTKDVFADITDGKADLEISSARELYEFSTYVNNGNNFKGKLIELTTDIVFEGNAVNYFNPIGSKYNQFQGMFNGNGHSISGINVMNKTYAGLFGYIGSDAVIKNVILKDSSFIGCNTVGGIVGYCNYGTIDNCIIDNPPLSNDDTPSISGTSSVGGIVGYCWGGTVKNCFSNASIEIQNYGNCGGVIGDARLTVNISNCGNTGNIKSTYTREVYIGGVIGFFSGGTLQNCYNTGSVEHEKLGKEYTAGICYSASGVVTNCYCSKESSPYSFKDFKATGKNETKTDADMKDALFLALLNSNRGEFNDWLEWEFRNDVSEYPVPINRIKLSDCQIILNQSTFTYTGKEIQPSVNILYNNIQLIQYKEYELSYQNNIDAGTATIIITGVGKYDGTIVKEFTIAPAPINNATINLSETKYTYSRYKKEPNATVIFNGQELEEDDDFTVTYLNNTNVGQATAKIVGINNYGGTVIKYFDINPEGTDLYFYIQPKKKAFKVSWYSQTTQTTGYEIQYSLKKNFKNAKIKKIKNNKKTSVTIKKLKAKKKYYVRIRTYRNVKINGKIVPYYSNWSSKRTVKTKK